MEIDISTIQSQFNGETWLTERRPGVFQLHVPLYHEDGDMVDIYLERQGDQIKISDHGMTLMRLSYTFELDTENKQRIFSGIVQSNGGEVDDGRLYIETTQDRMLPSVLQFAQVVSKVSSLTYLKREIVSGLFFEQLNEFVQQDLAKFSPRKDTLPISSRDDLIVPWEFSSPKNDVFLFPVRNNDQARLATISCLEFQRASVPFTGCIVHESFNAISKNDRNRITNAADKQFASLSDFQAQANGYFERLLAA